MSIKRFGLACAFFYFRQHNQRGLSAEDLKLTIASGHPRCRHLDQPGQHPFRAG